MVSALETPAPPTVATPRPRAWWSRPRVRTAGLTGLWLVVATWLQLARAPGIRPYQAFWAEDGGIFYAQALRDPLTSLLFTPHAGYLQVVSRLVSQPAAHLPLAWGAAYMATAAALVTAALAVVVFVTTRHLVPPVWARGVLAGVLPFLPQIGHETIASVANLHWPMAYAAFWVLLAAPTARWASVAAASALVAVAALSDPLTALLLPGALVGVWLSSRRRRALVAPAVLVVCLVVQYVTHVTRAVDSSFGEVDRLLLLPLYAVRVVLNALTGHRLLPAVYGTLGPVGAALAVLLVGAVVVLLWLRADRTGRLLGVVTLGTSLVYLVVALGYRGTEGLLDRSGFAVDASRYTIVPLMLLWATVAVLLARRGPAAAADGPVAPAEDHSTSGATVQGQVDLARLRRRATAPALLIGFLAVQLLSDWSQTNVRAHAQKWLPALAAAEAECQRPSGTHPPQESPLVAQHEGKHEVPLEPGPDDIVIPQEIRTPEGRLLFGITLSCSRLRDSGDQD